MTLVNLTALETILGGHGPIAAGSIRADYWAGKTFYSATAGDEVHLYAPINVDILNGAPVVPLELTPTRGLCCVLWTITVPGRSTTLARYTEIPDQAAIDFGDLVDVDPRTFEPTGTALAAWEAAVAEVAAIRDEVAASAVHATVDPDDPGVLVLTYPTFMLHPDGTSIVLPIGE